MIKNLFLLLLFGLLIGFNSQVYATDYYVAPASAPAGWGNGSDSNNGLSKSSPFLTIVHGIDAMSGGDTLIIADGTYTGSSNMIGAYSGSGRPPEGSASNYTVIKAENTGGVVIDGEGARRPVLLRGNDRSWSTSSSYGDSTSEDYIEINGIIARNSSTSVISIYYVNHIKLINVGAYDAADGNTMVFDIGSTSYVLLEGCYAWGSGRYKIDMGASMKGIIRNCVVRHDRKGTAYEPMGGIVLYGSQDIEVQNSIVIDSDQSSYFLRYEQDQGAFGNPGTSARYFPELTGHPNIFTNCISLNNHLRFGTSDWGGYHNYAEYHNCVVWDTVLQKLNPSTTVPTTLFGSVGDSSFDNVTFGEVVTYDGTDVGGSGTNGMMYGYNGSGLNANTNSTTDSIFYNVKDGHIFHQWEKSDNNNVYGLEEGKYIDRPGGDTAISTNVTTTDPRSNGLTSYILRIEEDSTLKTNGIGATIWYQKGIPGTLWGDNGYNVITATTLWPFPNEDLIKSKMQVYSYDSGKLTGDRGFASSTAKQKDGVSNITLTSYIWEYLGNKMPDNIYKEGFQIEPASIYKVETFPSGN